MTSLERPNRVRARARALVMFGLTLVLIASWSRGVRAAVILIKFEAAAQADDSILVVWETATELDTVAFKLYRAESDRGHGDQYVLYQPAQGDGVTGKEYRYKDTNAIAGVRYYYYLEELTPTGSGQKFGPINAGVGLSPLDTPTATATATRTPTATNTPPAATNTPPATDALGGKSSDPPTATRQFTLTPRPMATATVGSTFTPPPPASATATPIGVAVVSTPTGGPQPPAVPETITPLPPEATAPPAPPTPSPSPEIVAMSTLQPALELTPTATKPPQVFAAATAQPALGTPDRSTTEPTPVPAGETARDTGSAFLLGGGAILLAAAVGGGAILYLRSRQS